MVHGIMKAIQDNVNPTSVANALYEMMVDWRSCVISTGQSESHSTQRKYKRKRMWIETTIGRFIGTSPEETRALLTDHFFGEDYR